MLSGLRDWQGVFERAAFEKIAKDPAEDKEPSLWVAELLRSVANGCEEGTDCAERSLHLRGFGMQAGKRHDSLSAVRGLFTNRVQQQRAAGDGFGVFFRNRQTCEQRPPVVDQCDEARHDLAALQIVSGEAGPAPLVLQ